MQTEPHWEQDHDILKHKQHSLAKHNSLPFAMTGLEEGMQCNPNEWDMTVSVLSGKGFLITHTDAGRDCLFAASGCLELP